MNETATCGQILLKHFIFCEMAHLDFWWRRITGENGGKIPGKCEFYSYDAPQLLFVYLHIILFTLFWLLHFSEQFRLKEEWALKKPLFDTFGRIKRPPLQFRLLVRLWTIKRVTKSMFKLPICDGKWPGNKRNGKTLYAHIC